MEVNMHEAKTQLSKLIAAVESGEEVVIARAGKPVVKLVLVPAPACKSRKSLIGSAFGKFTMAEDFNSEETNLHIQRMFEEGNDTF